MECCNADIIIIGYGLHYGWLGLMLTAFLTGLVGSFTHCIGMCGPIAVGQMSMRLMNLSPVAMSEKNKVLCAASIPYYIGKSLSYAVLAICWFEFSALVSYSRFFKICGVLTMWFAASFFVMSAFAANFHFFSRFKFFSILSAFNQTFASRVSRLALSPFGLKGWVLGFALGFIPCGLVYATITVAVAHSSNALTASSSLFIFGIGTIPALFLVAYLGKNALIKWRRFFDMLYFFSMLANAFMLVLASLRYWSL